MSYQTPSQPCQAVYEIKKSEFLAFAYPIDSREQAMSHVQSLRASYPDARHHCYGYIIGDPHNTTSAGFDDDGEPNGTAGRPILNVLQHKAIGNCIIVVVRYFGGIKLGAGGLTRAYATAAQMAVDAMVLTQFVRRQSVTVRSDFANEAQVRYLVDAVGGEILAVDYDTQVHLKAQIDAAKVPDFVASLGVHGVVDEPV
ncbi:IMPACT family protein [Moraxella marmotae]|uniref:IMPACT family protein n=1 Tax=Moraxella marmotae TaxID=3344520 RepID=UPI0035F2AB77